MGREALRPPDASLTTMMVVFFSNLLLFPPLGVFRSRLLQMKYYYYCFRCWKGGVLVAVVDAPVEGRLKRVLVVHCCCGYCRWRWCWWCWCRERRQPLKKNKKAGGGLGGRAQRLPPRRIADDHDGGLCFEPVAVVVVVVVVAILEKAAQSKATATISTFKTEKIVLLPC